MSPSFRAVIALSLVFSAGVTVSKGAPEPVLPPWEVPSPESLVKLIQPPPAPGSAGEKTDLAEVLKLQAAATPEQLKRAQWTYNLSVFTFGEVLGEYFTPKRYPKTAALFLGLNNLVHKENDYLKNYYKRPHPFQVDPGHVKEFVIAPPGYSYPSYHSARCVVFAAVLTMLDPEDKAAFERVAKQVEVDRVLAGEHFPSDIRAGKEVGRIVLAALMKDGNFLAAVHQLRAQEWTPTPPSNLSAHVLIP